MLIIKFFTLSILLVLYSSVNADELNRTTDLSSVMLGKKLDTKKTQTNELFKSYLKLSSFKHRVLSENLANINTPSYKADDIEMPQKIEELANASQSSKRVKMYITSDKHIVGTKGRDKNFKTHKLKDPDEIKKNGNNVSLRQQMTKLAQNKNDYTAAVKSYATTNSLFSSVIGK